MVFIVLCKVFLFKLYDDEHIESTNNVFGLPPVNTHCCSFTKQWSFCHVTINTAKQNARRVTEKNDAIISTAWFIKRLSLLIAVGCTVLWTTLKTNLSLISMCINAVDISERLAFKHEYLPMIVVAKVKHSFFVEKRSQSWRRSVSSQIYTLFVRDGVIFILFT